MLYKVHTNFKIRTEGQVLSTCTLSDRVAFFQGVLSLSNGYLKLNESLDV